MSRKSVVAAAILASLSRSAPANAATDTVYIADKAGAIYRYDVASVHSSVYLESTQLAGAVGVVQEASGDLLVSVVGSNKILRIGHASRKITVVTQGDLLQNPTLMGIVGGEVFVSDPVACSIVAVNTTTGAQRTVAHGGLSNGGPWMCASGDGSLYVSRNANATIVRVDPATGAEVLVSSGGLLDNILGIAYSPVDHFLYVCCAGSQRIVRVDPFSGRQKLIVEGGFAGNPYGVNVGPDGNLWVAIEHSNRLFRVLPGNGAQTPYSVTGMSAPYGVWTSGAAGPRPRPPSDLDSCLVRQERGDSVLVQWAAGTGAIDYFQISRDDKPIATVEATGSRYADRPAPGPHTYCVAAANEGGSSHACCRSVEVRERDDAPHLDFVRDVPHDHGGKVMLGWVKSDLDVPGGTITGYRVWRRLPPTPSAVRSAAKSGHEIRHMGVAREAEYWEALATLPSASLSGYGYVAATPQGSHSGPHLFTAFVVSALTADPSVYYNSNPDSGYSVDNLAHLRERPGASEQKKTGRTGT